MRQGRLAPWRLASSPRLVDRASRVCQSQGDRASSAAHRLARKLAAGIEATSAAARSPHALSGLPDPRRPDVAAPDARPRRGRRRCTRRAARSADWLPVRRLAAALRGVRARRSSRTARPPSASHSVGVGGEDVPVREEVAHAHAVRHPAALPQGRRGARSRACCSSRRCRAISPRCCATPCARCCADHDVYITDWHNARDVPLARRPLRPRRVHRAPDRRSSTRWARARTWWRSASPASRRWPPPR